MRMSQILGVIILVITIGWGTGYFTKPASIGVTHTDNVYDRVMKSGKIRCGYVLFPPNFMKDPVTGKMSGISYDLFNKMGEAMNLKVEWTEEVPFGELVTALESKRIDAICSVLGVNSVRATRADFLEPPYYVGVSLWTRQNDHRFDSNINALNDKDIHIASLEGTVFDAYIKTHFPKASLYSLSQSMTLAEQMVVVATGKADATILDTWIGYQYAQQNPGKVKNLTPQRAFRIDPVAPMILKNQDQFKSMLNIAQTEQILTGQMQKIIDSYHLPDATIYPRKTPY